MHEHSLGLLQASQQDLAFAEAVSLRFAPNTALNPGRYTAEEQYADAVLKIGRDFNNSKALGIAAESYMNLSPWDYYSEVQLPADYHWILPMHFTCPGVTFAFRL